MTCARVRLAAARMPCVLLALACCGARAEQWSLDSRIETSAEHNDNYWLQREQQRADIASLGGALGLERRSESAQTRLAAGLTLFATHPAGLRDRADLSLGASHMLNAPRDHWSADLQLQRYSLAEQRTASDVVIGRGERRTLQASADWSHELSERASTKLGLSGSRTGYGGEVTGAVDYRNTAASAGASYRVNETDSAGVHFSRSQYRSGDTRTDSHSLGLSWQHAISERSSASVSVGRYRTVSDSPYPVLVCPLPIDFCSGGLVAYVVALRSGQTRSAGSQFDLALTHQASPDTALSLAASRQISPSGAGSVTRNDALSAGVRTAWSETLSGTASASLSRSSFVGAAGAAQPQLRMFSFGLAKSLGPELSLEANLRYTRSDDPRSGVGATARAVALVLKAQAPRRWSWF